MGRGKWRKHICLRKEMPGPCRSGVWGMLVVFLFYKGIVYMLVLRSFDWAVGVWLGLVMLKYLKSKVETVRSSKPSAVWPVELKPHKSSVPCCGRCSSCLCFGGRSASKQRRPWPPLCLTHLDSPLIATWDCTLTFYTCDSGAGKAVFEAVTTECCCNSVFP